MVSSPVRMTLHYVATRWGNDQTDFNTFQMKVKYYWNNIHWEYHNIGETSTKTVLNFDHALMERWSKFLDVIFYSFLTLIRTYFWDPLGEGGQETQFTWFISGKEQVLSGPYGRLQHQHSLYQHHVNLGAFRKWYLPACSTQQLHPVWKWVFSPVANHGSHKQQTCLLLESVEIDRIMS